MRTWKTKSGVEIVQVLNGRSNSYLIYTEKGNVLVDTGKASAFRRLQENIDLLRLPKKNMDLLILTHTHFDHCQNAYALKKLFNCMILVGAQESQFSEAGYTPLPNGTSIFTRIIVKLGSWIGKNRLGYQPFIPDRLISRETILEGYPIKIIPTPGHSKGSVSVIVDNEIALAGDTLFGIFPKKIVPPFADDVSEMIRSWRRLLQTNCQTFLPGHGREIKRDLLNLEFEKYSRSIS